MAEHTDGFQIEVSGVSDGVDEMMLTLLLESKKRMGRVISVVNINFNRERKAALVTLAQNEDFIQALRVGSTTLEGRTLNFTRPNMVLWTKSTVRVHNVPYSVDEEEIFLRFESRKLWGRELDVRQVTPDKPRGIVYITYNNERDALHVADRGISKLFGVPVLIEGPMFPPVSGLLTDSGFEESLNTGHFGQETSAEFAEEYPQGQNYNNLEEIEISQAIEASLLDSNHKAERNTNGEHQFYGGHTQESSPFENPQMFTTSEKSPNMKDEIPLREDDFGSLRVEEEMAMSIDDVAAFSDTDDADLNKAIAASLLERDKLETRGNGMINETEQERTEQKGAETESDEDPVNDNDGDKTQMETPTEQYPRVDDNRKEDTHDSHEKFTNTDHGTAPQGKEYEVSVGSTDKHLRTSAQDVTETRTIETKDEDQDNAVKHKENERGKEGNGANDSELFKVIEESEKKSIDESPGDIKERSPPQEKEVRQSWNQNSSDKEISRTNERRFHENGDRGDVERNNHNSDEKTEPGDLQARTTSSNTSTSLANGISDSDETLVPSEGSRADNSQNDQLEVFTEVAARVNRDILPTDYAEKADWKYNLQKQFERLEIRDQNGSWLLTGSWHQVLEARACLQMWRGQLVNPEAKPPSFNANLKSAMKSLVDGDDSDGSDAKEEVDEKDVEREMKEIERQFANVNGISSDLSDDEIRANGDGATDDEEPTKKHAKNINVNAVIVPSFWGNHGTKEPTMLERKATTSDTNGFLGTSPASPLLSCTMHRGTKVFLYLGDITTLRVGAIVNAANERLQHGGGVAQAIANAIGPWFQRDSDRYIRKHGEVPLSSVAVQYIKGKPFSHVINAVGPMWGKYKNKTKCREVLTCTFYNCLKCADEQCKVTSVAVPPISSGLYMVPIKVVAEALFDALVEFDSKRSKNSYLREVHIVDVSTNNIHSLKAILFCKFRQFTQT